MFMVYKRYVLPAFIAAALVLCAFPEKAASASSPSVIKKLETGLDEMLLGGRDRISSASAKTAEYASRAVKAKDDLGRVIARFVGGLVKTVTFWYPDEPALPDKEETSMN